MAISRGLSDRAIATYQFSPWFPADTRWKSALGTHARGYGKLQLDARDKVGGHESTVDMRRHN
eukprot:1320106-Rhodomonas_salina.1